MEPIVLLFIGLSILVVIAIVIVIVVLFKENPEESDASEKNLKEDTTDMSVLRDIPSEQKNKKNVLSSFLKQDKTEETFEVPETTEQPEDFTALKDKLLNPTEKNSSSSLDVKSEDITFADALSQDDENLLNSETSKENMQILSLGDKTSQTQKRVNLDVDNTLSDKEESFIEQNIDLSMQHKKLEEKYNTLDKLFQEKSIHLDKFEKQITQEKNNRKDFNKVKDILEKELKDLKNDNKSLTQELKEKTTENEEYSKMQQSIKSQITTFEKSISEKEEKVLSLSDNLNHIKELNNALEEKNQEIQKSFENIKQECEDLKQKNLSKQPTPTTQTPLATNITPKKNSTKEEKTLSNATVIKKKEDPVSGAAPYTVKNKEED